MKVDKIQFYTHKQTNSTYKNNSQEPETIVSNPIKFAYHDFNISFKALPPEKFYETDHNVKYMPATMKKYLNEQYETRRHLPPEQIMNQSFKFLELADSVEEAKETYPDEPLFENLHEAGLKGRSGILSDIKLASEMSTTPLFNDGSNNFGIYLLRKIFLEGKTIKEINKDFYEKDLHPEYQGIITQPITYGTTSAYGIRYPKTDFWNSFISTRDEYRKLYPRLPRQTKNELRKELIETKENKQEKPRKYTIRKFHKDQLKQDIKKVKGDEKAIADSIRKRFTKDDPEAAFIVKYLSPIMTIAADRIHLSEEERYFAENKKSKGEKIENFFAQFWKANPELLEQYSTAITDTIELFEENYASGGLIPINNDFQVITGEIENKKAIDYVPKEFLEILNYAQTIVPARLKSIAAYDEMQKQWEEHFLWRYGDIVKQEDKQTVQNQEPLQMLEKTASANNAKIYHLNGINGEDIVITANLDETFGDYIRRKYPGFPTRFVNLLINKGLKNPLMTENAKLSFSCIGMLDKFDDDKILGETERNCIMNAIQYDLQNEISAASMAMMDVLALKSDSPVKIYRNIFHHNEDDSTEYSKMLMLYSSNADVKAELNRLYEIYKKPLTNNELTKVTLTILDYIRNFDIKCINSQESVMYKREGLADNIRQVQNMLREKANVPNIRSTIQRMLSDIHYSKTLLENKKAAVQYKAKLEVITSAVINSLIQTAKVH